MASYAVAADIAVYAVDATALEPYSDADKDAALADASVFADSYLARRYAVPLAVWGADLRAAVCRIAVYRLLTRAGYDSAAEGSSFRKQYDDALAWLKDVAKGDATVSGGATAGADAPAPLARVRTSRPRGWSGDCE